MGGIIERIGGMASSDVGKAINLAHHTFQTRLATHGHHGRALIETIAEVCRKHPALVGLAAGIIVEQLLARAEAHHELQEAVEDVETGRPPSPEVAKALGIKRPAPPHTPHHILRFGQIRPIRLALEVFGALLLLKFSAGVARALRRKNHREVWFAPAGKIHLISGSLAVYFAAKSIKSKRISAWRNAAVALFATDALKPVLKLEKRYRDAARLAAAAPSPAAAPPAAIPPPPPAAAHETRAAAPAHQGHGHAQAPTPAPEDVHHPAPAPTHVFAPQDLSHSDHGRGDHGHDDHGHDDNGHNEHGHRANGHDPHPEEPPPPMLAEPAFHPAPEPAHRPVEDLEPEPDAF